MCKNDSFTNQKLTIPLQNVPIKTFLDLKFQNNKVMVYKFNTSFILGELPLDYFNETLIQRFFNNKKVFAIVTNTNIPETPNMCEIHFLRWADLHRHSGYSFLDGGISIQDMVRKTDFVGAITDHGNMHGTLAYYKAMHKAGKLPIIGMEAYAETINGEKKGNHLLLLAKNEEGYKNLSKLTSLSYDNIYYKPHISYEMLAEHSEGLISTTTCMGSEVSQLLLKGKDQEAFDVTKQFIEFFGKDDFYVEIQRHGFEEEIIVNAGLEKIARNLDLKIVATTDAHYIEKEDVMTHEVLLCMGTKKKMSDENRMKFPGSLYHLHSTEEMEELYKDMPEALDNTLEIAEKCKDLKLGAPEPYLPHFPLPKGFADEMSYLRELSKAGFKERFEGTPMYSDAEYQERLKFELDVIAHMGFPGYFLIVSDLIAYARSQNILVGPGRGSAAGSLVAYVLKITDLDPIPYGLLFERFLNPDRISMPDIDIDFQDDRRDEVTEYVRNKYGEKSVSKILAVGTLAARSVVRLVGKTLSIPNKEIMELTKKIPAKPGMTLKKAITESKEFSMAIEMNEQYKKIFDIALKLESLPRNASQHACGVVIADGEVSDYVPTLKMENEETNEFEITTQYDKDEVEEMGLLKMDFLGLRTLRVISDSIHMINQNKAHSTELTYEDIPYDDPIVYDDISKGTSYGVFQLESPGMRSFMIDLFSDAHQFKKPSLELFERLIAGVSLYRPGPMDHIPEYINNMRNPEQITYDLPQMKPILESTYGVIVYQEQTMAIVRELANFTKGEADNVRKAFAKQDQSLLAGIYEQFMSGTKKNGIPADKATIVWNKMKTFASYGFNKSHAAVYSILTARTGWLKKYYPTYFMTANLNSYLGKSKKLQQVLNILRELNIKILQPNVNYSEQGFSVEKHNDEEVIRFGFKGIRSMGMTGLAIVEERTENGLFLNFQDFVERMYLNKDVSLKKIVDLIYSGALDEFEGNRFEKELFLEDMTTYLKGLKKQTNTDQMTIFDLFSEEDMKEEMQKFNPTFKFKKYPITKQLLKVLHKKEKEYIGLYISSHPLDQYVDFIKNNNTYIEVEDVMPNEVELPEDMLSNMSEDEIEKLKEELGTESRYENQVIEMVGVIEELESIITRKGDTMYKFELADFTGNINMVIFANQVAKNLPYLVEGEVVTIKGKVETNDFGTQLIVYDIMNAEELFMTEHIKHIEIKVMNKEKGKLLKEWYSSYKGTTLLTFHFKNESFRMIDGVNLEMEALEELERIITKSEYICHY